MRFNIIRTVVETIDEDGLTSRHEDYTWDARYQGGGIAACPAIFDMERRRFSSAHECLVYAKIAAAKNDFVEKSTGDIFSKAIERWEKT